MPLRSLLLELKRFSLGGAAFQLWLFDFQSYLLFRFKG
jgi:hypothetical protein